MDELGIDERDVHDLQRLQIEMGHKLFGQIAGQEAGRILRLSQELFEQLAMRVGDDALIHGVFGKFILNYI